MATMTVSMPFEYYHHLTKDKGRKKSFQVWGVDWNRASFVCKNVVSLHGQGKESNDFFE